MNGSATILSPSTTFFDLSTTFFDLSTIHWNISNLTTCPSPVNQSLSPVHGSLSPEGLNSSTVAVNLSTVQASSSTVQRSVVGAFGRYLYSFRSLSDGPASHSNSTRRHPVRPSRFSKQHSCQFTSAASLLRNFSKKLSQQLSPLDCVMNKQDLISNNLGQLIVTGYSGH